MGYFSHDLAVTWLNGYARMETPSLNLSCLVATWNVFFRGMTKPPLPEWHYLLT